MPPEKEPEPQQTIQLNIADVCAWIKFNHPDVWADALAYVESNTKDILSLVTSKTRGPNRATRRAAAKRAPKGGPKK